VRSAVSEDISGKISESVNGNAHKTILLAGAGDRLNKLIESGLGKAGYAVTLAENVMDVHVENDTEQPDLVLLNIDSTGGQGLRVKNLSFLRERRIPFMVISESGDVSHAVEMMKQGAEDYIVIGPDFVRELEQKVIHLFETSGSDEALKSLLLPSESEIERYRLLAENSVDAVWQMNLRLKFTYMSKASMSILGYTPEEMMGKHLWEFAHRRHFIQMARLALTAFRNSSNFSHINFESRMLHKDGREVPVEITGKLNWNKRGRIAGFQGSTKDISERVKVQQQVIYQQNLLNTLINNIPDQIYVKDIQHRYLLNNRGHMQELGAVSKDELSGKKDEDFFDQVQAEEFRIDEEKVLRQGISIITKEEYKSYPNGTYRWTLTTKVPIRDDKGEIIGLAGVNRDITERKEREEELIRSRYELALKNKIANILLVGDHATVSRKLLEVITEELNSKAGFLGFIMPGGILKVSTRSEYMFHGMKNNEESGMEFAPSEWSGIWGEALKKARPVVSNEKVSLIETDMVQENALAVPIMRGKRTIGVITVANKSGGYAAFETELLGSICNYTAPILEAMLNEEQMQRDKQQAFAELLVAKEKAEASDKLKSAFLLNLSHEVRTPLNSIIGFANLLTDKYANDEKTKQFAEMIDIAGRDLMKMVEDTIDISRLENKDEEFHLSHADLVPILNELYEKFSRQFETSYPHLSFRYKRSEEQVTVNIDPGKFKKAVSKLLDNAGKFTPEGGVELKMQKNGTSVMVSIEDTGIGIPEDLQEAVFEKFRKIEGRDRLYRGNGLGLTIARELLDPMNCDITLDSRVDKGTKVMVKVPLA